MPAVSPSEVPDRVQVVNLWRSSSYRDENILHVIGAYGGVGGALGALSYHTPTCDLLVRPQRAPSVHIAVNSVR